METCEHIGDIHPVDQFICSKCGIWLEDWVEVQVDEDCDPPEISHYEYAFKYRSNCGRKVVQ